MPRLIPSTLVIVAILFTSMLSIANADQKKLVGSITELGGVRPGPQVFKDAKRKKPIEIKTADGLAKYFDEKQVAKLKKEVDFKQQVVLIFAWRGSGQDRLNFAVLESFPEQIVFSIKPGRTRDLRPHVKVFAVASRAKWSVK